MTIKRTVSESHKERQDPENQNENPSPTLIGKDGINQSFKWVEFGIQFKEIVDNHV